MEVIVVFVIVLDVTEGKQSHTLLLRFNLKIIIATTTKILRTKKFFARSVPANITLFARTDSENNALFAGTVL